MYFGATVCVDWLLHILKCSWHFIAGRGLWSPKPFKDIFPDVCVLGSVCVHFGGVGCSGTQSPYAVHVAPSQQDFGLLLSGCPPRASVLSLSCSQTLMGLREEWEDTS